MGDNQSAPADLEEPPGLGGRTPGKRLMSVLASRGMSVSELSRASGVRTSTVYRIMHDDCAGYLHTWAVIAEALGMSVSELTGK